MTEQGNGSFLEGITVLEVADELGEYCGKVLAGLGADVIKVEPAGGEITRTYGPFLDDVAHPDRSLHFWHYNHGKRGTVLDLDSVRDQATFKALAARADVILETRPRGYFSERGLGYDCLRASNPALSWVRITPFGDDGPWADFRGCDLVHLALGGVAMNCGYDPGLDGAYDTPPIAPQMWHAYHVAGEMAAIGLLGALMYRIRSGEGQLTETSVHQAVSASTETDIPDWVYQRIAHVRRTCRHSIPDLEQPMPAPTKDGRYVLPYRTYVPALGDAHTSTVRLLTKFGMQEDLADEKYLDYAYRDRSEVRLHISAITAALISRTLYSLDIWRDAQAEGLPWAPIRKPEENAHDDHWAKRETFFEVEHPELNRSFTYVGAKWYCEQAPWRRGPRAPLLGEHDEAVRALTAAPAPQRAPQRAPAAEPMSVHGKPFALSGIRIIDLSWMLASGGAGRFLAALGAEVVKVEHEARLDGMRFGSGFVPAGGREERDQATAPIPPPENQGPNDSGTFMEINAGKLAISLNLKSVEGKKILTRLIANADMVIEGFSPGTMDRMGFGYESLKQINPRIIYVQQSGMGQKGTYGQFRSYGPTAQAFTGISEMSGLPDPYPPAGIGYSYLDWFGAFNMALAMLAALHRQQTTGEGCWIDSSQAESGIYLTGTAVLENSANGTAWRRYGNASPYKPAAPHGIYRAAGDDRWVALGCFTERHWHSATKALELTYLTRDERFATHEGRLANQAALDELIGTATRAREPFELMDTLQAAGVPAGVCQTAEDRCDYDPQLAHLRWAVELDQRDTGRWPIKELPARLSLTPPHIGGRLNRAGPSYAQDNDYVFREILGFDEDAYSALRDSGAI
jgi:crotonobetainyl-CoA:carnitine CoA-transferase CaiB-like acyl-CoA transferase